MFKDLLIGTRTYMDAHVLIREHKLWGFVVIPGIVNLMLFTVTIAIGWEYSDRITEIILEAIGWGDKDDSDLGVLNTIIQWFFMILFRLIFIIFYLSLYKYIVLIIMSPVLAILSDKANEILSGEKSVFNLKQFITDVVRGITIAIRNLFTELIILFLLFIFFTAIPVIGWISPILMFTVEFFFYGFSMIDYTNERKKLSVKQSSSYIYKHKGVAIANGAMFYLMLMVPVVGLMVAPAYGVVAAAIAAHEIDKNNNLNGAD